MDSDELIKRLKSEGWYLDRVKGSHHQFKHPKISGLVTIKHPCKDMPKGTLASIRRQAGWK
ncbi:MAG: type II toxin-antitoxin system HicA family toxin [Comamonadaceae bacterium]|nr:type II toxin-antitoxin system HicA family toxin [Comamonadaceae bacterium]